MAWTAPMTAVDNDIFTAAQFNTYVRDNLLQTVPALMTAGFSNGSYAVKSGTNSLSARTVTSTDTAGSSTTTSGSYTDLAAGAGPSVTVTTGTQAIVLLKCGQLNSGANLTYMSFTVGGSTPQDIDAAYSKSTAEIEVSSFAYATGLTAGSNTFTAKYKVAAGTGTYINRRLTVIPL